MKYIKQLSIVISGLVATTIQVEAEEQNHLIELYRSQECSDSEPFAIIPIGVEFKCNDYMELVGASYAYSFRWKTLDDRLSRCHSFHNEVNYETFCRIFGSTEEE